MAKTEQEMQAMLVQGSEYCAQRLRDKLWEVVKDYTPVDEGLEMGFTKAQIAELRVRMMDAITITCKPSNKPW